MRSRILLISLGFSCLNGRIDEGVVMAPNTGRQFKLVLKDAQHHLRTVFGMEITQLPQKEKITISQKRGL